MHEANKHKIKQRKKKRNDYLPKKIDANFHGIRNVIYQMVFCFILFFLIVILDCIVGTHEKQLCCFT